MLKRSEFAASQSAIGKHIDEGLKPRVLVILDHFTGFESGVDWDDLDFQLSYGSDIVRIAIVGEPQWEPRALAFAGAGVRRAPVKFFKTGDEPGARAWLASDSIESGS